MQILVGTISSVIYTYYKQRMSKICIAPGEYFEHTHSRNSISHVISGKIDISLNGVVVEMSQGEEINIPAHCPHSFQNSSTEEVVIGCSYGP